MWLTGLSALLLWVPQNAAHEGAHCVAHKAAGDTIVDFWPFPGWRSGAFAFAYMTYRHGTQSVSALMEGLCSSAPQIANTLVLLALLPLHFLSVSAWLLSLLVGWGLVNFIDGAVNLSTFYRPEPKPSTDGWRTAKAWGLNPWVCRAFTVGWQVGMAYHLFSLLLMVLASDIMP